MGARRLFIGMAGVGSMLTALACGSDDKGSSFTGGVAEPILDAMPTGVPETGFIHIEGSTEAAADASTIGPETFPDARSLDLDATKLPGDDCPAAPPAMGSTCTQQMSCTYDACATTGTTAAQCDGQHWTLTTKPCDAMFPCPAPAGHFMCAAGDVCMVVLLDGITVSSCKKGVCGTGPINCRCGAYGGFDTCAGTCVSYEGHQVNCTGQ